MDGWDIYEDTLRSPYPSKLKCFGHKGILSYKSSIKMLFSVKILNKLSKPQQNPLSRNVLLWHVYTKFLKGTQCICSCEGPQKPWDFISSFDGARVKYICAILNIKQTVNACFLFNISCWESEILPLLLNWVFCN